MVSTLPMTAEIIKNDTDITLNSVLFSVPVLPDDLL